MPDCNSNVEAEQINERPIKVILYKVTLFKLRYLGFLQYKFGYDLVHQTGWLLNRLFLSNTVGENETVPCFRAHFEEQLKNYKKQVSATWQNCNLMKMQGLKANVFRLFFLVMCCGLF